jgi:hypothetical protein
LRGNQPPIEQQQQQQQQQLVTCHPNTVKMKAGGKQMTALSAVMLDSLQAQLLPLLLLVQQLPALLLLLPVQVAP